jgi:hypothetical protein
MSNPVFAGQNPGQGVIIKPKLLYQQQQASESSPASDFAARLAKESGLFPYSHAYGRTAKDMEEFLSSNLKSVGRLTSYNYINAYPAAEEEPKTRFGQQPDYKYFLMQMAN